MISVIAPFTMVSEVAGLNLFSHVSMEQISATKNSLRILKVQKGQNYFIRFIWRICERKEKNVFMMLEAIIVQCRNNIAIRKVK